MHLVRHTFLDADPRPRLIERRLVIVLGNHFRGDDGVGLRVGESLKAADPTLTVVEVPDVFGLSHAWAGFSDVVVVDAVVSGAPPGTIHRFDVRATRLPQTLRATSTHRLGLADALELERAMGMLPDSLVFIGIEGATFTHGAPMTPAVEAAIAEVVAQIARRRADVAVGSRQAADVAVGL